MQLKLIIASVALSAVFAGPVLAQSSSPACSRTKALTSQTGGSSPTTSMAGSTSDGGMAGSGASSASIATGPVDKTGVNNPCVPGLSGHNTGAVPSGPSSP